MVRNRGRAAMAALAVILSLTAGASPVVAAGNGAGLKAYLDGKRIAVADVGKFYCDDFDYPVIRCSTAPHVAQARATAVTLLAGADYVTIFNETAFQGSFMHVSQDYDSLLTIGWNDRVSSLKGRNSATGKFWTDWFMGGTYYWFCCNQQVSSLGSYDNRFSSVERT
jgi:hypothetical protein